MISKTSSILVLLIVLFAGTLNGQEAFDYPRMQNMPPRTGVPGILIVDPSNPMSFAKANGNPGLWALLPYNGLINMGYGDHQNSIRNSLIFAGFKIGDDFFLGFEGGGLMVPANWIYDLDTLKYMPVESSAVFGYWFGGTLGYKIKEGLAIGLSLALNSEELRQGISSALSTDVGIVWNRFYSDLTFGVSYRNLGADATFKDTSFVAKQPSTLNVVLSHKLTLKDFSLFPQVGFEMNDLIGSQFQAGLGTSWKESLTLQVGGSFGGDINYFPWSVGLQGSFAEIHINYTLAVTENSNMSHFFGLSWNFGGKHEQTKLEPDVEKKDTRKYYRGPLKEVAPMPSDTISSPIPDPPRNTRLFEEEKTVVLEWDPVAVGDKFLVYAKLGEKSVFRKVTGQAINETRFVFKKPSSDVQVFFYVKTVRVNEISGPSRVVSFINE